MSISPWRQAMIAGAATLVVGWCLFATTAVMLRSPGVDLQSGPDRRIARAERELKQAQAAEQVALSLLEKRTSEFQQLILEAEQRHTTLKVLMAHLQGNDTAALKAVSGQSATMLIDSTIEEADPRQGRPNRTTMAANETAGFRAQFDKLKFEQGAFLDAAEDEAVYRAERARGVIRQTGVPLARVLEESAQGGPLIEVATLASSSGSRLTPTDDFIRRTQEVAARLEEANLFETLIHTLPLGAPVGVPYRETSGFGYRSDPFTRRTAWHEGMDLAAYYGAPIIATAPGTVSYAGTRAAYGRVVELDHGLGFKTRFAHLQSITVKTGQTVAIGQKLGTMGSTGRSTGPHLHYEVFYRSKSYDPLKFLRAGKHVHEG